MAAEALADLAIAIYTEPAPVVLLDACAMLDVVRAPLRKDGLRAARGAQALIARAAPTPRSVWIVAAEQVLAEWNRHLESTVAEVQHAIDDAERLSANLSAAAALVVPGPGVAPFQVKALAVDHGLRMLGATLASAARVLATTDNACWTRAYQRTVLKHAPASQGKPEQADCVIIEHYLELARQLRAGGFAHPICFVSSNTADYGVARALRAPLAADFAGLGVTFATDLTWAESVAR